MGDVEELKIKLSQSSGAGAGTKLGNNGSEVEKQEFYNNLTESDKTCLIHGEVKLKRGIKLAKRRDKKIE